MTFTDNIRLQVEKVLNTYDEKLEAFHKHEVWQSLHLIRQQFKDPKELPLILMAHMLAFEIATVDLQGINREYPALKNLITKDVIQIWEEYANSFKCPRLKFWYSDLAWHYAGLFRLNKNYKMAILAIETGITILENRLFTISIEAREISQRVLALCLQLSHNKRDKIAELMIEIEDAIAEDDKPGLWGFSFDHLIDSKIPLSTEQESKIVADMTCRFERLIASETLHLWGAECAIKRLIQYYKKRNISMMTSVIQSYGAAVLSSGEKQPGDVLPKNVTKAV